MREETDTGRTQCQNGVGYGLCQRTNADSGQSVRCTHVLDAEEHGNVKSAMAENHETSSCRLAQDTHSSGRLNTDDCLGALPAAGYRNNTDLNNDGNNGNYWSSTPNPSNSNNAYNLNLNSNGANWNSNNRNNGQSVLPVAASAFCEPTLSPSLSSRECLKPLRMTRPQLLCDLINAYFDARRHKRRKAEVVEFEVEMEERLVELRDAIQERRYTPQPSTCFIVHEPKQREIFAAAFQDRIVHHLLYNYIAPMLNRTLIDDCYSCRNQRGTSYGIQRLQHHIRCFSRNYSRQCYVLKMDIRGYFMSINRNQLLELVERTLKRMAKRQCNAGKWRWEHVIDFDLVSYLCEQIILNDPTSNCRLHGKPSDWVGLPPTKSLFHSNTGFGMPIGNLTSQLFSNIFLSGFDHYMKRGLHCSHYGRYVDDFFVVAGSKRFLRYVASKAEDYLKTNYALRISSEKTMICDVRYGVDFLGAFLKPHRAYVRNSTLSRAARKLHLMATADGDISPKALQNRLNSFLGLLRPYKTLRIRRRMLVDSGIWRTKGVFDESVLMFYPFREDCPASPRQLILPATAIVRQRPCSTRHSPSDFQSLKVGLPKPESVTSKA